MIEVPNDSQSIYLARLDSHSRIDDWSNHMKPEFTSKELRMMEEAVRIRRHIILMNGVEHGPAGSGHVAEA